MNREMRWKLPTETLNSAQLISALSLSLTHIHIHTHTHTHTTHTHKAGHSTRCVLSVSCAGTETQCQCSSCGGSDPDLALNRSKYTRSEPLLPHSRLHHISTLVRVKDVCVCVKASHPADSAAGGCVRHLLCHHKGILGWRGSCSDPVLLWARCGLQLC